MYKIFRHLLMFGLAMYVWLGATSHTAPTVQRPMSDATTNSILAQWLVHAYNSSENSAKIGPLVTVSAMKQDVSEDFLTTKNRRRVAPTLSKPNNTGTHPARSTVRSKRDMELLGDFLLTAYSVSPRSTGKLPSTKGYGITYSGKRAQIRRTIAVDPRVIPIGSHVYIDGIGWRYAEDTGGAVKGRHIDVLLSSDDEAMKFGVKRHVKVYLETKATTP